MESVLPLLETRSPASAAETAQLVRESVASKTPVYPSGGGTALNYGGRPTREGIGLSLGSLSSLVDYPTRDLTITVEAGMPVAQLEAITAKEGQRLPVDIPWADKATVGGAIAAGAAGARRFACGAISDYVLGLDIVDGSGNQFSTGGRVVKNAAGYDLSRLFSGSLGSLGVITQATLMVKPIPEIWGFHACRTHRPERLLESLARSQSLPCAVELLRGPSWSEIPGLEIDSGIPSVVVAFEGPEAEVGWMLDTLEEEWAGVGETDGVNILGEEADALWNQLREFPAPREQDPPLVVIEMGVRPREVAALVERIRGEDPGLSIQAHAAGGIVRVKRAVGDDDEAKRLIQAMRTLVGEVHGRATVLSAPCRIALTADEAWGSLGTGLPVMQALKRRFDPHCVLNPGRTVY